FVELFFAGCLTGVLTAALATAFCSLILVTLMSSSRIRDFLKGYWRYLVESLAWPLPLATAAHLGYLEAYPELLSAARKLNDETIWVTNAQQAEKKLHVRVSYDVKRGTLQVDVFSDRWIGLWPVRIATFPVFYRPGYVLTL